MSTLGDYEIGKLKKLCAEHGIELIEKPNRHFQLKGAMLVNYYPCARTRTLYVAGTAGALKHATAEKAVAIATGRNDFTCGNKVERKSSYRAVKRALFKHSQICHWCQTSLTLLTATVDHVIPLSRGGLNNMNNYVLACAPCNHGRGNSLPATATR